MRLSALLLLSPAQASARLKPGLRVETAHGPVRGVTDTKLGVNAWWGVQFAAPPTGPLRFAPPAPPQNWTEERSADKPPPWCPQIHPTKKILLGKEDCLYLDVYAPADLREGEQLPVLFWIYGGAFALGDTEEAMLGKLAPRWGWYDGRRLSSARRVVVVSVNYRLGNFGFLALPSLLREHGTAGNWGLLDQQAGMRWVQANIASFGGDQKRVTIFGQSAGGISVTAHMSMPSSKGLFHAAVAESTIAMGDLAFQPLGQAETLGELYAQAVGCGNKTGGTTDEAQLACLGALPLDEALAPLLDYAEKYWYDWKELPAMWPMLAWWPVVDRTRKGLPDTPVAMVNTGDWNDVPLITGSVHDEGTMFAGATAMMPGFMWNKKTINVTMRHFVNATVAAAFVEEYPGDNATEALSLFLRDAWFTCPTRAWLRAIRSQRLQTGSAHKSFWYMFNYTMDHDFIHTFLGAYHTSEISYVFDNPWIIHKTEPPFEWSKKDKALSAQMQFYWSQFAATGDPLGAGCGSLPGCISWPEFTATEKHMVFDTPLVIGTGIEEWGGRHWRRETPTPKCDFWDKWGYDRYPR